MPKERDKFYEKEPQPKTAWLFPGQGTQFVGMGKELFEKDPRIRAIYEKADEILGYPLSRISFEGPAEILDETRYTQPATFLYSFANLIHAQKDGHNDFSHLPVFVAGHSFGTINALVAAQSLSFEKGLELADERAKATYKAAKINPGGMLVVKAGEEDEILKEALEVFYLERCVINANDQTVIGGPKEAVSQAEKWLKEKKVKTLALKISGAFHTSLMAPAVESLRQAAAKADIADAKIPVIANTTARPIRTAEEIKQELLDQLTHPVRWHDTILYLKEQGVTKTLEIGEKGLLSNLNQKLLGGATAATLVGLAAVAIWYYRRGQPPQ